jgi:flagellar hook-associated protein 1
MSNLLSLLDLGAAGLAAQHTGVSVAANNTANVNTEGYSRQRVDLRAQLASPLVGGVTSGSPRRIESELLASRERLARGASGRSGALEPALLDLEAGLVQAGPAIDEHLAGLWVGLERVAAMPTDSLVRDAAIAAARSLADALKQRSEAVAKARAEADARIRNTADQASVLAREIADSNRMIRITDDPVQRDRRDVAAGKLAALIGGEGRIDPDGQMRWVLPGGGVVVDGDRAATIATQPDPATGFHKVQLVSGTDRRDLTTSLDSGTLAGELQFRDGDGATTANQLDQLAFDLTTNVNAVHRNGAGLDGVAGRDLFVPQAAVAGAASRIAVDPAMIADSRRLAVAAVGTGPSDNQGVIKLLSLRDQRVATGGTQTLGEAAIDIIGTVGRQAAGAHAAGVRDGELSQHLSGLRDSLSGVDIDEELAKMVHFQHASEAMTRFLSTIDGMLGDLLSRL